MNNLIAQNYTNSASSKKEDSNENKIRNSKFNIINLNNNNIQKDDKNKKGELKFVQESEIHDSFKDKDFEVKKKIISKKRDSIFSLKVRFNKN